jgi:ribosomal 50S subunit-associated protein YjgA (DUF615 family)
VALSEDDEIVRILNSSKGHDEALRAVRAFVENLRKEGQTKDAILARMEALRRSVFDEQEDVLLEVMDFLVGWRSPHARID